VKRERTPSFWKIVSWAGNEELHTPCTMNEKKT
jgi:hypothetical protein